ncbi:Phosphatidylinositol transfer protein [Trinorchestia longiramus]|nr:Phosphatidylinositol transfer protein [Trinorchestia longiramus]
MVHTKEYRIPLPLTVEEYRIAQLYMIAKKSRMESHSEESGVQILVNEPYTDGPGPSGCGQYTRKIYYVASHLPGECWHTREAHYLASRLPAWLKALIPKSSLTVEEEAWNSYPYTKTRYTCSMVERFSLEVETVYHNDGGHQENVFNLSKAERKQCECDVIDVVRDQSHGADYNEAEDPTIFRSSKTGRGPLSENWIQEYWQACEGKTTPLPDGKAIMCAYKLCKVEFRYWGMQSKIEKFIHDVALRKTMLTAHQQAWVWQDEWWGLTLDDVRAIEEETMAILQKKYALAQQELYEGTPDDETNQNGAAVLAGSGAANQSLGAGQNSAVNGTSEGFTTSPRVRIASDHSDKSGVSVRVEESKELLVGRSSPYTPRDWTGSCDSLQPDHRLGNRRPSWSRSVSKNTLSSQSQVSWRMESIRRDSDSDDSAADEEFFDCPDDMSGSAMRLTKWSSLELLVSEPGTPEHGITPTSVPAPPLAQLGPSLSPEHQPPLLLNDTLGAIGGSSSVGVSCSSSPVPHCPTTILILVVHAGSVLETPFECSSKGSDLATLRHSFECVVRQQYPVLAGGGVAVRLIPADTVTASALHTLTGLSGNIKGDGWVPVGALPVIAEGTGQYHDAVSCTGSSIQAAYRDFINSPEGAGFAGHVCIVGQSLKLSPMSSLAVCVVGQSLKLSPMSSLAVCVVGQSLKLSPMSSLAVCVVGQSLKLSPMSSLAVCVVGQSLKLSPMSSLAVCVVGQSLKLSPMSSLAVCVVGDCVAGLLLYDVLCQDAAPSDDHPAVDTTRVVVLRVSPCITLAPIYASGATPDDPGRPRHKSVTDLATPRHTPLSKSMSAAAVSCGPNYQHKVSSQLSLPPLQPLTSRSGGISYAPPPSPTILIHSYDSQSSSGRKPSVAEQAFASAAATLTVSSYNEGGNAAGGNSQDLLPPSQQQILRKVSAPLPVIPSICCSTMPRKSSAPCTGTTLSGQHHQMQLHPTAPSSSHHAPPVHSAAEGGRCTEAAARTPAPSDSWLLNN